jgi:hypothetical protein
LARPARGRYHGQTQDEEARRGHVRTISRRHSRIASSLGGMRAKTSTRDTVHTFGRVWKTALRGIEWAAPRALASSRFLPRRGLARPGRSIVTAPGRSRSPCSRPR